MLREIEGDTGSSEIISVEEPVKKDSTDADVTPRHVNLDDCSALKKQAARLMKMFGVDSLDQIEQVTPYTSEEVVNRYDSEEEVGRDEPYVAVDPIPDEYDEILEEDQADIEKEAEMERALDEMLAKEKEKLRHLNNLRNKHKNKLEEELRAMPDSDVKADTLSHVDDLIPVEKVDKLEKINKMSKLEKVVPIKSMKKIIRMHELTEEQAHKLRRWQMERNGPRRVRTF